MLPLGTDTPKPRVQLQFSTIINLLEDLQFFVLQ